jgi:hypothetical protein
VILFIHTFVNCGNATFSSTKSNYVGVRILDGSDTLYGWIKLKNVDEIRLIIEEYACQAKFVNLKDHLTSHSKSLASTR